MSNPRANLGQILVAAGGILLALLTFMEWFGPGDEATAWKSFSVADIVIFFGALIAAGLAIVNLVGASSNLPPQLTSVQRWIGAVPALIAIAFIIEIVASEPNFKFGGVLALLAALVLLAGTIMLVRPDIAQKVEAATANIGTGTAPGAGPGPGPGVGGPGYGAGQPAAPSSPTQAPAAPGGAAQAPPPQGSAGQPATAPQPAQPAQPAQAGESGGPAAGWYPDPQGQKRLRYWDGGRWTEQTAD